MNENELMEAVRQARLEVEARRKGSDREALARSLESAASLNMKTADVVPASEALEEAGRLWSGLNRFDNAGNCYLLAASSFRLASMMDRAARSLDSGQALRENLDEKLRRGFVMERSEQHLASGRFSQAVQGFAEIIGEEEVRSNPLLLAQVMQRRAAASIAGGSPESGADDLLECSRIYETHRKPGDAEACGLAASAALCAVDPEAAEKIYLRFESGVPENGAAACRRGMVGGKTALSLGKPELALKRFDQARQGALDTADPVLFFSAAVAASEAAESAGEITTAYGRLASAWVTLSDLIGKDSAGLWVRPVLANLKLRLGDEVFNSARRAYEKR